MISSRNRLIGAPSARARESIAKRLTLVRDRETVVECYANVAARELSAYLKAECLRALDDAERDGTAAQLLDEYRRATADLEATTQRGSDALSPGVRWGTLFASAAG